MNLPVRLRWIVLAGVTAWIGLGMVFASPGGGSHYPVEAATPIGTTRGDVQILRMVEGPIDLVGCRQNCWFSGLSPSKIVVYQDRERSTVQSPHGKQRRIHWSIVGQHGTTWHSAGFGGGTAYRAIVDSDPVLESTFPINVKRGTGPIYRWGIVNDHLLLIGSADDGSVARVEVQYDTGEVTSDVPVNDIYVSLAQADAVCEIRARGYDGEIIERISAHEESTFPQSNPNRSRALCANI